MKDVSYIIEAIISHQEMVIGPLAYEQARKVAGLEVSKEGSVKVVIKKGDEKKVLGELVKKYENIFGQASVEVCKDAVKESASDYPESQLPEILKS